MDEVIYSLGRKTPEKGEMRDYKIWNVEVVGGEPHKLIA